MDVENAIKETIVQLSEGNPGALNVLVALVKDDDQKFLTPFFIAFAMTKSRGFSLWLVYKDMCDLNLEDTKTTLTKWFNNSTLPLEKWVEHMEGSM